MTISSSNESRRNILERIRKAQGRGGRPSQPELEAVDTYLNARPRGPLSPLDAELVSHFRARAEAMQCTTEEVASMADLPAAIARYLQSQGVPAIGCIWPSLFNQPGLDWASAGLSLEPRAARDEDRVGISGAFAAIAETGTLMVLSGADTPSSVSLLPDTHIAVLSANRIVSHMEAAWDLLRAECGHPPRAVNFISGPSRTGDIDQTIVLGVHGPFRVHIVLVRN